MHRIAIVIPHFGPWPEWIDHFVESCRANRTIDWILFSDAEPPANRTPNVRHIQLSFADYKRCVSERLGIAFDPPEPYKLCDVKPALGLIHADLLRQYDFVGFGDVDVIYGNLRDFLDERTLRQHDVISSHADRISGHLCLMRNRKDVVTAFTKARSWRAALASPAITVFDEQGFYRVFRPARSDFIGRLRRNKYRALFREVYSTPTATHRMAWFWEGGRLTNEFYPQQPFMYLHFMSWHSNRWYGYQPHVDDGAPAPWAGLSRIVQVDWREARTRGFMISPSGIQALVKARFP